MKRRDYLLVLIIAAMVSCKKPYTPSAVASPGSYLVVEGVINSGSDSTIIKLSKTVNLSARVIENPVLHASLTVEGDQNNTYPLTETANGNYVAAGLNLDNTRQYRLRIKMPDNQQYLSDFEPVIATPPIDSVGYNIVSSGVQIFANTHDPKNNTHYYRWDYQETWQFHSLYFSQFVTNGKAIVLRSAAQQVYDCFGNDASSNVVLASTTKLTQDVVYQVPITQVASISEKLETKYSILVKQYALTGNAYNFWVTLKKNTEQLGSIFDAQPSEIKGNIHNTANPSEPVIGYVSVSTIQQKRIFISNAQLPQSWVPVYPYTCEQDSALYCHYASCQNDVAIFLIPLGSAEIPVSQITDSGHVLGFFGANIDCVDCTIRGTKTQPAFWK